MKKKIFLGLLLGALSFGSCVKDNESEAVKKQRDAQAELLLAQAKVKSSEADLNAADAKIKEAQAELDKKLIDSKVQLSSASSTQAWAIAETKVEEEKTAKAEAMAKFDANVAKAKAEAENILAGAEALKINNLNNLVAAVNSATATYSGAVSSVTTKENEINTLVTKITKLKAGVVSVSEYVEREKAAKKAEIEAKELELAAYKDMVKSNFGTINDIKAKLFKKENEANLAKIAYNDEFNKVKGSVAEGTSYEEAKTKLSGEELAELAFFKRLKEAAKLAETAATGNAAAGYSTNPNNFAYKQLTKNVASLGGTSTNLLLDSNGSSTFRSKTTTPTTQIYSMEKEKYSTEAELQAGFFNDAYVETAKGYFDFKIRDAEAELKKATNSLTLAEAAYTTANASATTNTDTTQQQNLDNIAQQKKIKVAEAKIAKKEAEEEVTKAKGNKTSFEEAIAEVTKKANQTEVLKLVTKFIEEQKTLVGKLEKLEELEDKYDDLAEEKTALEATVKNVAQVIANEDTAKEIAEKIKSTEESISDSKEELAILDNDNISQEHALKMAENKLDRYNKELELLKKQLDAARDAYNAAIEALKKAANA